MFARLALTSLLAVSPFLLTGCTYFDAPGPAITWYHSSKSAGGFELDQEHCQSQVQAFSAHLEDAHNPYNRVHRVNDCMRIKGYTEGPPKADSFPSTWP